VHLKQIKEIPTRLTIRLTRASGTRVYFSSYFLIYLQRMKGKCLLGEHMVYERRKAKTCCYNGKEYEREINHTSCNCTMEDFMW
jgi:hypothetical protein